jgi:hypothetical protein
MGMLVLGLVVNVAQWPVFPVCHRHAGENYLKLSKLQIKLIMMNYFFSCSSSQYYDDSGSNPKCGIILKKIEK